MIYINLGIYNIEHVFWVLAVTWFIGDIMAKPFFIIRRPEWISALVVFCPEGPLKRGMIGACISFFPSFFLSFLFTGVV